MALRVPKAELPAELRESFIKQIGFVPEPVEVGFNNPDVAMANQEYAARVASWNAADQSLKTFAHMAVAAQVGCSWCLDINYFLALNHNLDLTKASQVPRWRESDVFIPLEREVLEYAEAMTNTPTTVTDELSASLLKQLGPGGWWNSRCSSASQTSRPGSTRRTGSRRRATPMPARSSWPSRLRTPV